MDSRRESEKFDKMHILRVLSVILPLDARNVINLQHKQMLGGCDPSRVISARVLRAIGA
jgi:hypothetical protein